MRVVPGGYGHTPVAPLEFGRTKDHVFAHKVLHSLTRVACGAPEAAAAP